MSNIPPVTHSHARITYFVPLTRSPPSHPIPSLLALSHFKIISNLNGMPLACISTQPSQTVLYTTVLFQFNGYNFPPLFPYIINYSKPFQVISSSTKWKLNDRSYMLKTKGITSFYWNTSFRPLCRFLLSNFILLPFATIPFNHHHHHPFTYLNNMLCHNLYSICEQIVLQSWCYLYICVVPLFNRFSASVQSHCSFSDLIHSPMEQCMTVI